MSFGVHLLVSGPYACFTRPEMKVERVSYDVMTPSAARGILEAVHWKPAIRWIIDEIRVLKPVRFQSLRRNEVGAKVPAGRIRSAMRTGAIGDLVLVADENRQLRTSTILCDVAYVISAHFELTAKADAHETLAKHLDIFTRRARKGQCFHQPCLGTREFVADFRLIEPDERVPQGISESRDLGFMLWGIDHVAQGASLFFRARLENGVVRVPQPGAPEILR
ncbi:type I-C CRISPR-associated protein Cas5c [Stappia sp. MMSF_3263]|nr:type I-C CRISPR-associated protein Cas5c [Stappia sp. MMSF_3263]